MHYSEKSEILNNVSPTYAINLNSKHYSLSSGYSVRVSRNIFNSWLYENLSISLPSLPTFSVNYARQGTRDIPKDHNLNSNSDNLQFGIEDNIGPFQIMLNRQERNLRDFIRGSKYDVKTSETYGNINFSHSFTKFLSLNGQYGIDQNNTEGATIGNIKSNGRDFSVGFQITPLPTISLLGTTVGHSEKRENFTTKTLLSADNNNLLTNTLQLRLEPLQGILVNTIYSKNNVSGRTSFDENKSLMLDIEPWQGLGFTGQFLVYDSQRKGIQTLNLTSNSFEFFLEPIEGLKFSSRLNLSNSNDLVSEYRSDRDNITVGLEAMPTMNLRTNVSYDWQRTDTRAISQSDKEIQHRVESDVYYSFNSWLNLNLSYNKSIYSELGGSDNFLRCEFICTRDKSNLSFLYSRSGGSYKSSLSLYERQEITQSFTILLDQEINQNTTLSLDYESQINDRELNYRVINKFTFRVNIRF